MKKLLVIPFLVLSLCVMAEHAHPYFKAPEMPNALHYLPGPPQTDEMRYAYDTAQYNWGKRMRPTPRVVASAAFARLHTSKTYLKQLEKAQKEFRKKKR